MIFDLRQFGQCEIEGFPSFRHTAIVTDRLLMRAPRVEDFKNWVELRTRNIDHLKPFDPEWAPDWNVIENYRARVDYQQREWRAGRGYFFCLFDRYEDKMIGGLNVNNVVHGSAQFGSLGYWICDDYEGKGMMSEAMDATITFCFDAIKLERLNAATLEHNARSQKLLERFGFEKEGLAKAYLNINGKRQDHILYGLNSSTVPV